MEAGNMGLGLVVGKFMPPTLGHKYLIEFARRRVDELVVVAGSVLAEDSIPIELRVLWLRRHFGDSVTVTWLEGAEFTGIGDLAEIAALWRQRMLACLGGRSPDVLFASEAYGKFLSAMLGCRFVALDVPRSVVGISATQVRADPFNSWDYILPEARSYYLRTIRILCDDPSLRERIAFDLKEGLKVTCLVHGDPLTDEEPSGAAAYRTAAEEAAATVARRALIVCAPGARDLNGRPWTSTQASPGAEMLIAIRPASDGLELEIVDGPDPAVAPSPTFASADEMVGALRTYLIASMSLSG